MIDLYNSIADSWIYIIVLWSHNWWRFIIRCMEIHNSTCCDYQWSSINATNISSCRIQLWNFINISLWISTWIYINRVIAINQIMDLCSMNYGDPYISNYGYPSTELCSSKIELQRSTNRIMEIHNWKNGSPSIELWGSRTELWRSMNLLLNSIIRQALRGSITVLLGFTDDLRSPITDWRSSTIYGAS